MAEHEGAEFLARQMREEGVEDLFYIMGGPIIETAGYARDQGLGEQRILPTMDDWEVFVREAVATGLAAQELGVAKLQRSASELEADARTHIEEARATTQLLMREELILPAPVPEL